MLKDKLLDMTFPILTLTMPGRDSNPFFHAKQVDTV